MENDRLHESLKQELNKGKELAKDLAKQLRETSSSNNSERLVENILSSYNEALLILSGTGRAAQGECHTVISSSSDPPSSSISLCNVTQSKDSSSGSMKRIYGDFGQTIIDEDQSFIDLTQSKYSSGGSLKRNIEGAPDEQSLISSLADLPGSSLTLSNVNQSKDSSSGLLKRKFSQEIKTVKINEKEEDGYSWRKYGQKNILGSVHPRSYYRCAFRLSQGCLAVKLEHRSDEDPTISYVTYRGVHTCSRSAIP